SPNLIDVQRLADRAGIDFFLIERSAFEPEYLQQDWLMQSEAREQVKTIMTQLKQGLQPTIATKMSACGVVSTENYVLLDTKCL
ncbi:hypothetical protein VB714_19635, partial [Spirulina sp. 06S082]